MDATLVEKVKHYVKNVFLEKYDNRSTYHSYEHTREVAEAAEKIGKASGLNDAELEAVIIAAWFHDVGYLVQQQDHESCSANMAADFLSNQGYAPEKTERVESCILATRMTHVPTNLMEEVIHDADYINLANPDNLKQSEMLRDELVNYGGDKPTDEEWLASELKFLLNHRYYTAYARQKLEDKKADNIKKIKKKLKKWRENEKFLEEATAHNGEMKKEKKHLEAEDKTYDRDNGTPVALMEDENYIDQKESTAVKEDKNKKDSKEEKDKKEKKEQPEKKERDKQEILSIKEFDAIYKLIATNHMRMNAIADRKANIMLTLNGIIISITLSVLASASDANPRLIIPSGIMILVCLFTIIFAALSTRPNITKGTVEKEDIINKKANLLFFGNFSRMEYPDYDWGMRKMITDQEYLHNSMIVDFYSLGKVLDLKYRYLRICYNIFMFGIIIAVISIAAVIAMGY